MRLYVLHIPSEAVLLVCKVTLHIQRSHKTGYHIFKSLLILLIYLIFHIIIV